MTAYTRSASAVAVNADSQQKAVRYNVGPSSHAATAGLLEARRHVGCPVGARPVAVRRVTTTGVANLDERGHLRHMLRRDATGSDPLNVGNADTGLR
jgi:hypothetical protein